MNQLQPIPLDCLRRVEFGIVTDLADLLTGFRRAENIITPGHGSQLDYAPGEMFVSTGFSGLLPSSWEGNAALVATPTKMVRENGAVNGSFEFMVRKVQGHVLVLFNPKDYIGSTWLAFVPLENVQKALAGF